MSNNATVILFSTLTPTRGFHTTSTTCLALGGERPHPCTLHLYFTLPAQVFADPYELEHSRALYTFERFGGGNLEAPAFTSGAGGPWGLLLDVRIPEDGQDEKKQDDDGILSVRVPFHARYGVPKTEGELINEVVLPPPEAFWACAKDPASSGGSEGEVEQIPDTLHKVVELTPALNEKRSTLILISHVEPLKAQKLHVPVGDARDVALVENSTMVVILLAFLYLLRAILRGSQRVDDTISSRISISTEKKDS